ncbi:UNVERIFIED_CONTAM: hypothetical protein PYX00_009542 [Menopon gallinae]|uniref:Peptidase S1 domain-containing protein n=1 Tax=Menopon gallinae TaxID=328185 RepID=A0AAW2HBN9_9NEOP
MNASFKCVINLFCVLVYLIHSAEGNAPRSTCPGVFHYETMDRPPQPQDMYVKGVITVQEPLPIRLTVRLQLSIALTKRYMARLELAERKYDFLGKLNYGGLNKVRYNLFYPADIPLPQITLIAVNNRVLCSFTPMPARVKTTVSLEHTLSSITSTRPVKSRPNDPGENQGNFGHQINYPNFYHQYGSQNKNPFLNQQQNSFTTPPNIYMNNQPNFYKAEEPKPNFSDFPDSPPPNRIPDTFTQNTPTVPPYNSPNRIPDVPNSVHSSPPKQDWITFTGVPGNPHPISPPVATPDNSKNLGKIYYNYQGAPLSETCGKPLKILNPLIAGGAPAKRGDWPWMVPLFKKTGGGVEFLCSSTLISDQFIVTAAHCLRIYYGGDVDKRDLVAYVGMFSIQSWVEESTQPRGISEIHIHPDYNQESLYSDLALLKLQRTVTVSAFVNPACIWSESEDLTQIVGRKGIVFGWGTDGRSNKISDIPRLAIMPIVSQDECLQSKLDFKFLTSNRTFCAGLRNGTGPCNGDSGGGLLLPGKAPDGTIRWYLRGLTSLSLKDENSGLNKCNLNEYIIFTDVAKYKSWLSGFIPNIV